MNNLMELLFRSMDDENLTPEEQNRLNRALASDRALAHEKQEMERMRKTFSEYAPSFKPGFSERITNKIYHIANNDDNLWFLFKRFALTGVAAIVFLLITVYLSEGSFSLNSLLGLSDLTTDNLLLALSTF